jgi:hypothetical protein
MATASAAVVRKERKGKEAFLLLALEASWPIGEAPSPRTLGEDHLCQRMVPVLSMTLAERLLAEYARWRACCLLQAVCNCRSPWLSRNGPSNSKTKSTASKG